MLTAIHSSTPTLEQVAEFQKDLDANAESMSRIGRGVPNVAMNGWSTFRWTLRAIFMTRFLAVLHKGNMMCNQTQTPVYRKTRWVIDPPHSCYRQENWCHLGRHWFLSWGGNAAIYRNRECCIHCYDRAVAKLEAKLPKGCANLLNRMGMELYRPSALFLVLFVFLLSSRG